MWGRTLTAVACAALFVLADANTMSAQADATTATGLRLGALYLAAERANPRIVAAGALADAAAARIPSAGLPPDPQLQLGLLSKLTAIAQRASRWMLRARADTSGSTDLPSLIDRYQPAARGMRSQLTEWLPATARAGWQQASDSLSQAGVEPALAQDLTALEFLFPALDLVDLAQEAGTSLEHAARAYFGVDAELGLTLWRSEINRLPTDTLWQTQARGSARDDVYSIASQITLGILSRKEALAAWRDKHAKATERLRRLRTDISTQAADLAPVSVALRELRHLA